MDDGNDYDVTTTIKFRLNFVGGGEMNLLSLPDVQRAFISHIKEAFLEDDTLREYITGDLNFHFDGCQASLDYVFHCFDENEAEAESFSEYCVRGIQKELEAFGCKLLCIDCMAEEVDMAWFNQLEDAVFGPGQNSAEEEFNDSVQGMGGMSL